eukprot:scaffold156611_cov23-Tisochrysis_lutea.AAC.1
MSAMLTWTSLSCARLTTCAQQQRGITLFGVCTRAPACWKVEHVLHTQAPSSPCMVHPLNSARRGVGSLMPSASALQLKRALT